MTRVRQALVATSIGAFAAVWSVELMAEDNAARSAAERAANSQLPERTKGSDSVAATTGSAAASDQAAALAFEEALSFYSSGDVEGAFRSMKQSYLLSGRAELLFNLAGLERELARCQAALRDYDGYLRNVPNGKFRSDAERASGELQKECPLDPAPEPESSTLPPNVDHETAKATPAPAVSAGATKQSYWTAPRVIGWSAVGTGVLSGGFALYFLNAAIADHHAAAQAAVGFTTTPKDAPWLDDQAREHRELRAARVLGVTAGALVAGGVAVLILTPNSDSSSGTSATIAAYPGYLGAVCSGSF